MYKISQKRQINVLTLKKLNQSINGIIEKELKKIICGYY